MQMLAVDAAFARVKEFYVCADEDYVHGVGLTLKVHEPPETEEGDKFRQYITQKENIDELYVWEMLGSYQ